MKKFIFIIAPLWALFAVSANAQSYPNPTLGPNTKIVVGTTPTIVAPSATTDTTNATNISSGALSPNRIGTNALDNTKLIQLPTGTIQSNILGVQANAAANSVTSVVDVLGNTRGSILERGAAGWTTSAPGIAGYVWTSNGASADPSYQPSPGVQSVPVRQTVLTGPVSAGLPTFLPATGASLNLTSQNITSSAPLILTAANGFNSAGAINIVYNATSNLTWSGLTASTIDYLYVNLIGGTTGFTTLQPIYQCGGTPSTTNLQYTFDYCAYIGYMGNGTTAPTSTIVFVGEATTGASSVTATVAYAYQGFYDSGSITPIPAVATVVSKNSNIGTTAVQVQPIQITNITAEQGFSVGDTTTLIFYPSSGLYPSKTPDYNRNTIGFTNGAAGVGFVINKSTGGGVPITAANWSYRLTVRRAF